MNRNVSSEDFVCFDVTLRGYDGDTYETDHLVKWVKAPSRDVLTAYLNANGLAEYVKSIEDMNYGEANPKVDTRMYGPDDGVDLILDVDGVIYADDDYTPQRWINESEARRSNWFDTERSD